MPLDSSTGDAGYPYKTREWLHYLRNHPQDASWLLRRESELLQDINTELQFPPCFQDAVALLITVFPFYALVRAHARQWGKVLRDALIIAQDLRDSEIQIQIFTHLGASYAVFGKPHSARTSFEIAAERAKERRLVEMRLAAYIGLVRLQTYHLNGEYDPELLDQVVYLMRQAQDNLLVGMAHQTLATAYGFIEDWKAALGYGQTAYGYWLLLNERLYLAQTAFLLAVVYRKLRRFDLAERFLKRSREAFAETGYARQYGLSAYEQGAVNLQHQEWAAAKNWLQIAYRAFKNQESPYDIAMSHHALALAETGLGQLESARENLKISLEYWKQLNNQYELANAYQALAYLEGRAGNREAGLWWLDEAEKICAGLPSYILKRERLRTLIANTRDELLNNAPDPL